MKQYLLMMVGFSRSGKTTLAKQIQKELPNKFIRLDAISFHNFLNNTYPIFQDDNTIEGDAYWFRHKVTKALHRAFLRTVLKERKSIIMDSCNLKQSKRSRLINLAKEINPEIIVIIINVNISEKELLKRLKVADKEKVKKGEKPAWVELYTDLQKERAEKVEKHEGDYILTYENKKSTKIISQVQTIVETDSD